MKMYDMFRWGMTGNRYMRDCHRRGAASVTYWASHWHFLIPHVLEQPCSLLWHISCIVLAWLACVPHQDCPDSWGFVPRPLTPHIWPGSPSEASRGYGSIWWASEATSSRRQPAYSLGICQSSLSQSCYPMNHGQFINKNIVASLNCPFKQVGFGGTRNIMVKFCSKWCSDLCESFNAIFLAPLSSNCQVIYFGQMWKALHLKEVNIDKNIPVNIKYACNKLSGVKNVLSFKTTMLGKAFVGLLKWCLKCKLSDKGVRMMYMNVHGCIRTSFEIHNINWIQIQLR